jgi:hypothetical protein
MQHIAYVLLPISEAATSNEARERVWFELSSDSSFGGERGRYSGPVCKSFAIGGRWSGRLYSQPFRNEFFRQVDELNSLQKEPGWYSQEFINNNRERLDVLWQKMGGKYASPLTRNPHAGLGEEEDARLLDESLAERLNIFLQEDQYTNNQEYYIARKERWQAPVVLSLDNKALFGLTDFNDLANKYWVVAIDYHK